MKERLNQFVSRWQAKLDDYHQKAFPTLCKGGRYETVEVIEGKKYWKIVCVNAGSRSSRLGWTSRAFIDKETGAIYKSASWNAPAKHARGYITAEDFGMSCMTEYGPNYLR